MSRIFFQHSWLVTFIRAFWRGYRVNVHYRAFQDDLQEGASRFVKRPTQEGLNMKYIVAIIQPSRLTAVHEALVAVGVEGLTSSEVQGYGRQKGKSEVYRGAEYTVHFLPKIKIELAVAADMADKAIEAIKSVSATGKIGDGKIFILNLEDAMRIRTGETGVDAL